MLNFRSRAVSALGLTVFILSSCDLNLSDELSQGSLTFHFPEDIDLPRVPLVSLLTEDERKSASVAESSVEVQLDTNDFIISVTNSAGASLYYGTFGAAPDKIITSGTYTVSAKSCEFYTPVFSSPQFGDSKVVVVSAGKECSVTLDCVQLNSGVRIKMDPQFLTEYPNGVIFLKSSEGKLMYGYSEKRIAYFRPGKVSLVLNDSGKETTLATYTLNAREILDLKLEISASSQTPLESGLHVKVDTARVWIGDKIVIGAPDGDSGSDKGSDKANALSVSQAKETIGASDVWVYGYVVGGDLSSSKCSFTPPFSSKTNIVLAAKSSCTDKEDCLSVQLSSGSIRDAINLVDNPGILGKKIYLKGDIVEAYYGIPGLQSVSEYGL